MTTTLNATTSNGLVVTPDNSGNILLQYNGQSAPAFSAYAATNQSYSANVATKVNFGTEEYDTNSNFASSRFTPTVAGYYQLNYRISVGAQYGTIQLWKNGALYGSGNSIQGYAQGFDSCSTGSTLVYANGSTDYFEIYVVSNTGTQQVNGSGSSGITLGTSFQGFLVRGA